MNEKKLKRYISNLTKEYRQRFSESEEIFNKGCGYFPNKVSQVGRMLKPFPPFIKEAKGVIVKTVEGIELIDFWQGHFCNILGHNPSLVVEKIKSCLNKNLGLQAGLFTELEGELASLLSYQIKMDNFIFTTSGASATMHSILLGLAYTKREKVLKIDGGWHGSQPWSLKGVRFPNGINKSELEGAGLSKNLDDSILTVPFNNTERLVECFKKHGNDIGAFILEPVLGNSGMIVASKEFISKARELTTKYGTVLILDEIVTGFRVRAGGLYELYGIKPDIVILGKAISGGMPFACMAGSKEIFAYASISSVSRVWADMGTFTSHPATLYAVISMIKFLSSKEREIYPQIIKNMNSFRESIRKIFEEHNIPIDITGMSSDADIPNFPIGTIRFLDKPELYNKANAISHWDSNSVNIQFRNQISKIAMLLKGIHTWQGLGVMTFAHKSVDLNKALIAYREFAAEIEEIFKD